MEVAVLQTAPRAVSHRSHRNLGGGVLHEGEEQTNQDHAGTQSEGGCRGDTGTGKSLRRAGLGRSVVLLSVVSGLTRATDASVTVTVCAGTTVGAVADASAAVTAGAVGSDAIRVLDDDAATATADAVRCISGLDDHATGVAGCCE